MTTFIEEQREHRREVNARFDTMDRGINARFDTMDRGINARFDTMERGINVRFDNMEESQREHTREVNARLISVEGRTDRVADRVAHLMLAVLGIVGTLSIAVIVASIFS